MCGQVPCSQQGCKPLNLLALEDSSSVYPAALAVSLGTEDPEQWCDAANWGLIPAVYSYLVQVQNMPDVHWTHLDALGPSL